MKAQNQIIVSIGSNQGNRLDNLLTAIDLIHQEVATVIKVSAIYETPAWGFESDAFYNAAILLHSTKNPQKLLNQLLKVEKQLGRIRTNEKGYQARTIDLDIIAYNDEIISTENLQVPHPQMQHRKFVLLPLRDLDNQWQHPKLHLSVTELLATTTDESQCEVVQKLLRQSKNCVYQNSIILLLKEILVLEKQLWQQKSQQIVMLNWFWNVLQTILFYPNSTKTKADSLFH
jgi:deoxyguanosine kinase